MLEMAGVSHRYVEANRIRLHVVEAGDPQAPVIVLSHGWPQHWWMWRHVIAALAPDHRVIAWDLRGMGWSDPAPDGDYTKSAMAADLLALLDALGLERVGLVGHDWGGFSGMLACLRAPERFDGFVCCSIPHLWPSTGHRVRRRQLELLGYQGPIATPILGPRLLRRGMATQLLKAGRVTGRWSDEELAAYGNVARTPKVVKATVGIYRQFLLKEAAGFVRGRFGGERLRVPTRLLAGTRDVAVRGSTLDGADAEDLTVHWAPGRGHFLVDEDPDLVLGHIGELL